MSVYENYRRAPWRMIVALLLSMALYSGNLSAQTSQATIAGVVTDAQGAVVAEAVITARNLVTGIVSTTRANGAGLYSLPNLPIGEYEVLIEHSGFSRFEASHVVLTTGHVVGLNAALTLEAVITFSPLYAEQ